jgi:hypothetical protein
MATLAPMPLAAKNDGTRLRFSRQVRKLRSLPTTSTPTIPFGSLAAVCMFPLRKHSGLSARQRNSRTRAAKAACAWMGSAWSRAIAQKSAARLLSSQETLLLINAAASFTLIQRARKRSSSRLAIASPAIFRFLFVFQTSAAFRTI